MLKKYIQVLIVSFMVSSVGFSAMTFDFTFESPTDTQLTLTVSGSATVTSLTGAGEWNSGGSGSLDDLWRDLAGDNELSSSGSLWKVYDVSSGITASVAGGDSVSLNQVLFYTSGSRSDFSVDFTESPSPAFGIGQTVVFSGTATVDLGTDVASILNTGTWTESYAIPGLNSWTDQFTWNSGDTSLNLSISQVPEPASALLISVSSFGLLWIRKRFMA